MPTKVCPKCSLDLPGEAYYPDTSKRSGLSSWCRDCSIRARRDQYADPSQRDVILARNRASAHRYRGKYRKQRQALRLEMIEAYGGRCECCGEHRCEFLTADHINGDGAEERRELGLTGAKIHVHLKKLGWPKDRYRLLCFNCNCSIGIRGYCPHENE